MGKLLGWLGGILFWFVALGVLAHLLNLDDLVRASVAAGHLLDWILGAVCFLWLLVVLKVPWDLFFQAHAALWEMQRASERGIALVPGRETYVRTLRTRLGRLAVLSHLASAALVAGVAWANGGVTVGYYFAVFYVVSTLFRPAVAGYVYLSRKLADVGQESRYPRNDVVTLTARAEQHEIALRDLANQVTRLGDALQAEQAARENDARDLRQRLHALGREFETTAARLTDNQEVIGGIQAFVRLVTQAGRTADAEA